MRQEDEREAITQLLQELEIRVYQAYSGRDAIILIEDHQCDCLISDIQLPDMHAWRMLSALKETTDLKRLPTLVLMDEKTVVPLSNVTPIVRPVSMASLKNVINATFSLSS